MSSDQSRPGEPTPSRSRHRPPAPSGPPLGGDRELPSARRFRWWRHHRGALLGGLVTVLVVAGLVVAVLAVRHVGDVPASEAGAVPSISLFPSATPSPSASASASPTATATTSAPATSTAKGKVQQVGAGGRLSVAVEKGLVLTVVLTPTTVVRHGTAAGIHVGTTLTATGRYAAGVLTADTVVIQRPDTKAGSGGG